MCGIACIVSSKIETLNKISFMNSVQRHRGPDDSGCVILKDKGIALGHRRLSVIDLSKRSKQPMIYLNKIIIYNGEIYNYKEIKTFLTKQGYYFKTNSDTEVILASYNFWGEKCIDHFNGMWAFIIYDRDRDVIFCSRDRLGIKPLYYSVYNSDIFIASEIKALLAGGVPVKVDEIGLLEYFTFQNIISDRTLFENIYMLPAGHNLKIDLKTREKFIYKYWDLNFEAVNYSEKEASDIFLDTFKKSLERHLISDVDIGATLSGGIDSSAIVSITSKYFRELHTFTGYFDTSSIDKDDRCVNEKDDARIVSNIFKTTHHEREINYNDVISTLPQIIWHLEDPKVGMCYTFYTILQLVGQFVTVNLSGTGGDEFFGGYPWRYELIHKVSDFETFKELYYKWWNRLVGDNERRHFFRQNILKNVDKNLPKKIFNAVIEPSESFSPINRALYFDVKTFLHGFLMVEDKLGMAYSVETRFPFLDYELIEFARVIPDHLKYSNSVGKILLRKAFENILPKEIIFKRKQGFTPPDKTWYRLQLKDYIERLLLSKKSVLTEYIDRNAIKKILHEHYDGKDNRLIIWSLMFFEGWCRVFLSNDDFPCPKVF